MIKPYARFKLNAFRVACSITSPIKHPPDLINVIPNFIAGGRIYNSDFAFGGIL